MDETTTETTTARARAMRKALTPPEARVWLLLKTLRAQGCHFRRQVPFRGYFLDFACHKNRLVIEVDGGSHDGRREHDAQRDGALAREGYRTLRFTNQMVRDEFPLVEQAILAATNLSPSPSWGGKTAQRSGWGARGLELGHTNPTLRAAPAVPPHEGEGEK